jgi:type IV secretory pathway VirB4 component
MDPNNQNYPMQDTQSQQPAGYSASGVPQNVQPQVIQPNTQQTKSAEKSNPNSTQNTLLISDVRDGVVIMNDGSFRSVVMLKSINFDLMSPQEQEAVEYAYQGFLNSLYFPIQIFVRSKKIDIGPYIEKLSKIRSEHDNMLLAMLMDDYINFMVATAEQTNIMDKQFYIVIPFFPTISAQKAVEASKSFITNVFGKKDEHVTVNEADLKAAKDELKNRIQAVLNGLLQCSIQGIPLDTQELIELYYDAYNPDTATRQQLKNFDDLTVPVVTKGSGQAPQAHYQRELQ